MKVRDNVASQHPRHARPVHLRHQRRGEGDRHAQHGAEPYAFRGPKRRHRRQSGHGKPHAVQDVDAEQVGPRRRQTENPELQTEGERQEKQVARTAERGGDALERTHSFPFRAVHEERQRDARQEQEYGRRHAARELRQNVRPATLQIVLQERIEDVSLQHDRGAQAADPVEVLKAMWAGFGFHGAGRFALLQGVLPLDVLRHVQLDRGFGNIGVDSDVRIRRQIVVSPCEMKLLLDGDAGLVGNPKVRFDKV